jgi:hypothetical protein
MELLDRFKISATSKDGHNYIVELASHPNNVLESFNTHMSDIGWDHYQYTITNYILIKSKNIKEESNDTIN